MPSYFYDWQSNDFASRFYISISTKTKNPAINVNYKNIVITTGKSVVASSFL